MGLWQVEETPKCPVVEGAQKLLRPEAAETQRVLLDLTHDPAWLGKHMAYKGSSTWARDWSPFVGPFPVLAAIECNIQFSVLHTRL